MLLLLLVFASYAIVLAVALAWAGHWTTADRRGGAFRDRRHGANVGSVFWAARVSRADVADFMLNQLASDTYLGTAPGVCA